MSKELLDYVSRVAKMVNDVILENVKGPTPELYSAALHYVKAGGKRLRPAVVFLVGEGLGCRNAEALAYVGAAVEVLHTYTLIHDDIMDKDTVRRGVPTVHVVWGVDMAILSGDLLYAYSFHLLSKSVDKGLDTWQVVEMLRALTWASIELAEGQAMDMEFEKRDDVHISEYLEMIRKKTAALFEACAALGAIAARAGADIVGKMREVMRLAGIAFQIKDDVLGITVATEKLGKPRYSDIREGKKTLPIIIALERVSPSEREYLLNVLKKRLSSEQDVEKAAKIIEKSGAIEESERMSRDYVTKALELLDSIPFSDTDKKHLLKELIRFVVARGY